MRCYGNETSPKEESMNLEITIEKLKDDVVLSVKDEMEELQIRHDGILLNGNLHFWEEILFVQITNRELLTKLKR